MVGQVGSLDTTKAAEHWKAYKLDLTPVLHEPESAFMNQDLYCSSRQDHGLDKALDQQLIVMCREALDSASPVRFSTTIANVNRTVGTMLGHEVTKAYKAEGLPDGSIDISQNGSAAHTFGADQPRWNSLRLECDANDYVGKGLSGGRLVVRPDRAATFEANEHIIAGNTIAYGATSGEIFIRGGVGERFAVRNSGARLVTEGAGDHACEYMTGGRVAVLGKTGRNFAAGMSGGVAWVLDLKESRVNRELVELAPVVDDAADELEGLVRRHFEETGSTVAEGLLADWETSLTRFTEVIPRDFRIVMDAKAKAEADGLDENETATKMMEALHG
jgi:glutamate synthase (NADPH/NADH) large chain